MSKQIPVDASAEIDRTNDDGSQRVVDDVAYQRLLLVNAVYYGMPGAPDRQWLLIDTGVAGSADPILRVAKKRFGENSRPAAIVLTHGHFDHVGAVEELAEAWGTPVFAHELEVPYLDGSASYPPPDPTVGGGLMATLYPPPA